MQYLLKLTAWILIYIFVKNILRKEVKKMVVLTPLSWWYPIFVWSVLMSFVICDTKVYNKISKSQMCFMSRQSFETFLATVVPVHDLNFLCPHSKREVADVSSVHPSENLILWQRWISGGIHVQCIHFHFDFWMDFSYLDEKKISDKYKYDLDIKGQIIEFKSSVR